MQPPLPPISSKFGGRRFNVDRDHNEDIDGTLGSFLDPSFFDPTQFQVIPGGVNPIITPPGPGLNDIWSTIPRISQGVRDTALDIYKTKAYIDALKAQSNAGFIASPYYIPNTNSAAFGIAGLDMKWVLIGAFGLGALVLLKDRK